MNELQRLQIWYATQCNGGWEHQFGVRIETLDNPGWMVEIDLMATDLEGRPFEVTSRGDSEASADWIHCQVEPGKFVGCGGSRNLNDILDVFLRWADR